MKFSKIYSFKEMNSYQYIAAVGLVMTFAANIILIYLQKDIPTFWALYACWTALFVVGSIVNFNSKPEEGHHHH